VLGLKLLGDMEIVRDGERAVLPPSRKTRALLAYLATTAKPHRRERLCALLWDLPDDPRGALRWSLSRLRNLVDEPAARRIVATRETVLFEPFDADVDLLRLRKRLADGLPAIPLAELEQLAGAFRGEFLEGLDLPDLPDFQAWCVAEREDLRRMQARILSTLIEGLAHQPEASLPHARELVKIDPFDEAARANLLQILLQLGRQTEAERSFEQAVRAFKELGRDADLNLQLTWRRLREKPRASADQGERAPSEAVSSPLNISQSPAPPRSATNALVGREAEWTRLSAMLGEVSEHAQSRVVLVSGEPGIGKSRLLAELIGQAKLNGVVTFAGQSFETDRSRPYGPWIDVLGAFPAMFAQSNGKDFEPNGLERERLFATVTERVLERPALIAFDDVQWCDEASVHLLQHVVHASGQRPLLVVVAARNSELPDNAAINALLRSLRQMQRLHEIRLSALSPRDIVTLVQSNVPDADAKLITSHSGGNPLYALEMARSGARNAADMAASLKQLVRDRIERLPVNAAEALTWASVLGAAFRLDHLARIVPLSPEQLSDALEVAERHELLRETIAEPARYAYRFAHDLVHRAVYTALSEPRRRLMHLKAARALQESGFDEVIAADIAHHAALGGEAGMAAAACVAAGRRCLRLFANAAAEALARKGLHYAEGLDEPSRSQRMLELSHVEILARRPIDLKQAIARINELAERALDLGSLEHARLGYHMLSHLRWESGSWADAQRDALRAEFVSRSTDEKQQVHAMAEAARCLALLERDLGQAEALAQEARAVGQRLGVEPNAIYDALGLLRLHQGAIEEAAELFQRARDIARREGERSDEFFALEHLIGLEIQCRRYRKAEPYCDELVELAEKLRDGSEAPCARALQSVCRLARGEQDAGADFARAADALRATDAKHRFGFALICAAEIDIERNRFDEAREKATEALQMVTALDRTSEIAAAHSLLARVASASGDRDALRRHSTAMREFLAPASCWAQTLAETVLEPDEGRPIPNRVTNRKQS